MSRAEEYQENRLAYLIREFYHNTGYNDYDLASMTGLTPQAICLYRLGKRTPRYENLKVLSEILQVSIKEISKPMKRATLDYMLDDGAFEPEKAHEQDAGYDLRTPFNVTVPARSSATIDTGVHIKIPVGWVGMVKSKSGLNVKHGLNCEGVIDAGYTGSIVVKMYNHSDDDYTFKSGDKVTQLVILPILTGYTLNEVDRFEQTERGSKGFGSSGR